MPRIFSSEGERPVPPQLPDSMPWLIYQAYLQGPSALFRLFEDAFGRHALYGPPEPEQQQRTIDALSDHVGRLKAQIEKLQAEVSELHGRNFQLGRRNAELESLISKDSHNSSRPPSTDPPWAKRTRSLRRPSGRLPGGQAGHHGRRCGSQYVLTASSSTGPASVDTVALRSPWAGSCVTAGSKSSRSCRRGSE
jgi:uncharacterized coiled-coil protein SlyX